MRVLLDEARQSLGPTPPRRPPRRISWPRPSQRKTRIGIGVVAFLTVLAVWIFGFSPVFALEQVVVEGVRAVTPAQIVEVTELTSGEPLARVGLGTVEGRVRSIQAIADVEVSRRWPDTIVISVVERNRLALIKSGAWFEVIDETGRAFDRSKRRPPGLPLMLAPEGSSRIEALEVLQALPPDLLAMVESVNAGGSLGVVLSLADDIRVAWGDARESALKADVLRLLLRQLDGEKWIDVRVPANPSSAGTSPTPAPPPPTETATPPATPGGPSGGPSASTAGTPGAAPATPAPALTRAPLPAAPPLP